MAYFESSEFSTSNPWVKYKIQINTEQPNIEQNKTPISVSVFAYRKNVGYETYGTGTCYCRIDGVLYEQPIVWTNKITENGTYLFKKNIEITHESNGEKHLFVSAWFSIDAPCSSSEQGTSFYLPPIQRASEAEIPTKFVIGDSVTIKIKSESDLFMHEIYAVVNGIQYQVAIEPENVFEWKTGEWDEGRFWKLSAGKGDTVSGLIRLYTFTEQDFVGQKEYPFTASVPSEYMGEALTPSISAKISPSSEFGVEEIQGLYVSGKTKIRANFEGTEYNDGIGFGSYSVSVMFDNGGAASYSSYDPNSFVVETPTIIGSGEATVFCEVTDKSGRHESVSFKIDVLPYSLPSVGGSLDGRPIFCGRVSEQEDGTFEPNRLGERVRIQARAILSSLGGANKAKLYYRYANNADGIYTEYAFCKSADGENIDGNNPDLIADFVVPSALFDKGDSFTFQIVCEDLFGRGNPVTQNVSVSIPTWHAPIGGNGFALNMMSDMTGYFQNNFASIFYKDAEFKGRIINGKSCEVGREFSPTGIELNNESGIVMVAPKNQSDWWTLYWIGVVTHQTDNTETRTIASNGIDLSSQGDTVVIEPYDPIDPNGTVDSDFVVYCLLKIK